MGGRYNETHGSSERVVGAWQTRQPLDLDLFDLEPLCGDRLMAGKTKDNSYWIGFDLGGSKMLAVVFDDQLKPLARQRKKTKGHEGSKQGLERLLGTISDALDKAEIKRQQLGGIGIGCPGPLDLDQGILVDAPNLGWQNVALKKLLEAELGCPAVIVNDVDCGLYGEYRFGAGRGGRCVVGVFPGTGIGGSCVYEDRLLRGKTSSCMEIGHVQVMPEGPLCGCGRRGCLEALASRLAIASAAAAAAHRGEAPHLMAAAGADLAAMRSGVLARAIEAGDVVVEQIVRTAADWIGVAVAGTVHLLAPDTVVLGGGLVEAMPELFVETVSAAARRRVMDSYADSFRVVAAELGDDASVLGAAAWARHQLEKDPK